MERLTNKEYRKLFKLSENNRTVTSIRHASRLNAIGFSDDTADMMWTIKNGDVKFEQMNLKDCLVPAWSLWKAVDLLPNYIEVKGEKFEKNFVANANVKGTRWYSCYYNGIVNGEYMEILALDYVNNPFDCIISALEQIKQIKSEEKARLQKERDDFEKTCEKLRKEAEERL
jgi:hypothetical protein